MGMEAILVTWPGPFEQTFVSLSHGDSIWNLASIGAVVSEEKMFKECGLSWKKKQQTNKQNKTKLLYMYPTLKWSVTRLRPVSN